MSEREIRKAIEKVCSDLDLKARRAVGRKMAPALIPFAIGAVAVTACDDETETPGTGTDTGAQTVYGVPSGTPTGVGASGGTGGTTSTGSAGAGGAGGVISGGGSGGEAVGGAAMEYMAPDPD